MLLALAAQVGNTQVHVECSISQSKLQEVVLTTDCLISGTKLCRLYVYVFIIDVR